MRLAASNIGWTAEQDDRVLSCMAEEGFTGLELAPTRLFPERPYEHLREAAEYAAELRRRYGLSICSLQSIWYGQTQRVAESEESRRRLLSYTEQALRFADALGCRNLVFGCPRNRAIDRPEDAELVEQFLWQCGEAAKPFGVVVALEPNPPIYQTNFINTTAEAIKLLQKLGHPALKLNLDFGTVIENGESLGWISQHGELINHVHISEPRLAPIRDREAHRDLLRLLGEIGYKGFVSIEMGSQELQILPAIRYLGELGRAPHRR